MKLLPDRALPPLWKSTKNLIDFWIWQKFHEIRINYFALLSFIGTEKGNVHILNMDNFTLSGYRIDWNKLMDLTQKNHPGKSCKSENIFCC